MKFKYETPELEIVRFLLETRVLTASVPTTDTPEEKPDDNPIEGDTYNPFLPPGG